MVTAACPPSPRRRAGTRPAPSARFGRTFARLAAAGLFLAAAGASAQVLQIGPDGAVQTYSGPAVFTDAGATPIAAAPAARLPLTAAQRRAALERAARAAALSPDLVAAVAWRESGLRPGRVSRVGAVGEMQLMPATARALHVDPTDTAQNLTGGAGYLDTLMRRYDGDLVKALAAYNAGPGAVDRYHGVPPYRETRAYVDAVLDRLSQAVLPAAQAR